MSPYFSPNESIDNRVGEDVRRTLEIIANRYIGNNPPLPFVFHVTSRQGFMQLDDGRYDLNFQTKFPEATSGQWVYAYAKIWSDGDKPYDFSISSYSPTTIQLDGDPIYRSLLAHETKVQTVKIVSVQFHPGWNSILVKTHKTPAGFGCVIGTAYKRWAPLDVMSPFSERDGQAGWIYSSLADRDVYPDKPPSLDGSESATSLTWFPRMTWDDPFLCQEGCARIFGLHPGKTAYAWSQFEVSAPSEQTSLEVAAGGATTIWVDGKPVWQTDHAQQGTVDLATSDGRHDLLIATVSSSDVWGCAVSGVMLNQPYPIKGCRDPWLYLGPFDQPLDCPPSEIESLYKLFHNNGTPIYWRVDMPSTWVRPFLENENYAKWNYQIGVTLYGLMQTGRLLGRKDVIDYCARHVDECVKSYAYSLYDRAQYGVQTINLQLVEMSCLDDCGSFGAAMLEAYKESPNPESRAVADVIADYILNKQVRTPDGAFYRVHTMWIDDLYMSTPFLGRYYKLTGKREYIDEAARQFLLFKKYLFIPEFKIMSHIYDFGFNMATGIPWGRGNGWCLFSLSEVLEILPDDHPDRPALLDFFRELCEGYLALQGEHGLWRQVLNDVDAYEETSCTAMFAYAFSRGVRFGWLKEPAPYVDAVHKAWRGLTKISVDRFGNVHGVCRGSNYSFSPEYYKRELLWRTNDTHGIGIVLLAGGEVLKLQDWLASR